MIINLLFAVIIGLLGAVFTLLPVVSLSSIPVIGTLLSATLVTIVTTWNAFMVTFPYAETGWNVLLLVILPFELLLLIGKFFLGHRMPAQVN